MALLPGPMQNTAPRLRARPRPRLGAGFAAGALLLVLAGLPALGFLSLMGGDALTRALVLTPFQLNAIRETGLLLAGVGLLAGSMGLVSAWLVAIYAFPGRRVLDVALVLPLAFPTYLAAFVAVDLFDFFGPVQTLWRALVGAGPLGANRFLEMRSLPGAVGVLALVLFPYVYVSCRLLFAHGGRNVIDAARLLGARGFGLFFRIGLPLARPALTAGLVLVALETINDIGASEHLGVSSLSVVIRDLWLNRGDLPAAARMAGVLILVVTLVMLAHRPEAARRHGTARPAARPRPVQLRGPAAWAASFFAGMPVLLGFVLPAGFLLWRAVGYAGRQAPIAEFASAALSTLMLALLVALIVMVAGAMLAIAIRIAPGLAPAGKVAALGYAIPGTVLVLSVFPVLRAADDALAAAGLTLALSGSLAGLVYALSARFAGIGAGQAGLALRRLPPGIDWVARVHGMNDLRLALTVHLPAMRPGLLLGGTLVFIDTVKELPATLLMRPLNLETLATRAYAEASAGTFEHAAIESLAILVLGGCAALMLVRNR
jgi:iron(III) transport system permease protein